MRDVLALTKYGKIRGDYFDGVYRFLGVRYAKAPVGELRFQPLRRRHEVALRKPRRGEDLGIVDDAVEKPVGAQLPGRIRQPRVWLDDAQEVLLRRPDGLQAAQRGVDFGHFAPGVVFGRRHGEGLAEGAVVEEQPRDEARVVAGPGERALHVAGRFGQDNRLAAPLIHEPFTQGELGVLMPKGSEDLLDYVNEFLAKEKASGRIDELAEEYFFRYVDDETMQPAA